MESISKEELALLPVAIEYHVKSLGAFMKISPDLLKLIIKHPGEGGYFDPIATMITAGLRADLPCREIKKARWPLTWWDAVKDRWAPKWSFKRLPYEWNEEYTARKESWFNRFLFAPVQWGHITIEEVLTNAVLPKGMGAKFMISAHGGITRDTWHDRHVQCPNPLCRALINIHENHPKDL